MWDMRPPQGSDIDDSQLEQYLLGLLPAPDSERLDRVSIEDDAVAARLELVELDLIDRYVRHTLDGDMRARFEARYLSSPRRRQQIELAGDFLRAIDREAARMDAERARPPDDRSSPGRDDSGPHRTLPSGGCHVGWTLSIAAASLVLVTGVLLIWSVRSPAPPVPVPADLHRPAASTAAVPDAPSLRPSHVSSSLQRPIDRSAPMRAAAAGRADNEVVLILAPPTRAAGAVPVIAPPAGGRDVAIELQTEAVEFDRYRASLKDPATGRVVWRSAWAPANRSAETSSVAVTLPATLLKAQRYWLELSGRAARGTEVVGSYVFAVERR